MAMNEAQDNEKASKDARDAALIAASEAVLAKETAESENQIALDERITAEGEASTARASA